jgi:integrase/recombinase XerD
MPAAPFPEARSLSNGPPFFIPAQAADDAGLIELWLHGRPCTTRQAYTRDMELFLGFVLKPQAMVTVGDIQRWMDSLVNLKPSSRSRRLSAIKSLFGFAQRVGYVHFNCTAPLRLPAVRDQLAQRIVPEASIHRMLAFTPPGRDHTLLRLLYASGLRLSEVAGLRWSDCTDREEGGQLSVFGKGQKTRQVLIPATVWIDLKSLRGEHGEHDPIFRSRQLNAPLSRRQIGFIVKKAAIRAGLPSGFSPHWCRHAHASHALDRNAPIHVVSSTLGHASLATTSRYSHARPGVSSGQFLAL